MIKDIQRIIPLNRYYIMCLQAERVTLSAAKRRRSHAQVNKAHKNSIPEYYGSV